MPLDVDTRVTGSHIRVHDLASLKLTPKSWIALELLGFAIHDLGATRHQIRECDPHARRSQAYRLSMRSRRAKPGPGHAGHPNMDLYWRTLLVCGQSAPTRVGAARPRRAAEPPPAPRGQEAKTHDLIERPRHTTPDVADSASGRASVPTRRTDVPRGAAPGRTATA